MILATPPITEAEQAAKFALHDVVQNNVTIPAHPDQTDATLFYVRDNVRIVKCLDDADNVIYVVENFQPHQIDIGKLAEQLEIETPTAANKTASDWKIVHIFPPGTFPVHAVQTVMKWP